MQKPTDTTALWLFGSTASYPSTAMLSKWHLTKTSMNSFRTCVAEYQQRNGKSIKADMSAPGKTSQLIRPAETIVVRPAEGGAQVSAT